VKEERIEVTARELDRLKVVREVLTGKLKQREAAIQLEVSTRQVRKLCKRVRREGNKGIIHGLRGKPSNRGLEEGLLDRAISIVREQYGDFGPTLANEKLAERHGIQLSTFVLRNGMIQVGLWRTHKSKVRHRAWRQRRACLGELVQLDGSTHDWFEGRGPQCVLIAYIDDATGRVLYAEFVESEDTLTLMHTTGEYLKQHGRPVAFYVDKDSIYKINRQASIEEQLRDSQPTTQFTRAMKQLGIEVITANSPQAKGRVERLFGTLQDRLVKELRLAKIHCIAPANKFIWNKFLSEFNQRFSVAARNSTDAHRRLYQKHKLEEILCIRTERTVMKDYTVRYQGRWYQIAAEQAIRVRPTDKIWMETRLDGTTHLHFKGYYLGYQLLEQRPMAAKQIECSKPKSGSHRWKPPGSHPWRRPLVLNESNFRRRGLAAGLQSI
jgi:transposase